MPFQKRTRPFRQASRVQLPGSRIGPHCILGASEVFVDLSKLQQGLQILGRIAEQGDERPADLAVGVAHLLRDGLSDLLSGPGPG